jgi:PAS domain S-box-containing protein
MKKASDFMTPNPKMIGSGEPLLEVIRLFLEEGITSCPIVNPLGEILGVLTELSLVKAYMLHQARFKKEDRVGHHIDLLDPIHYVSTEAPIIEILTAMIMTPTHRLLVQNRHAKIVGIISPKDLMRATIGVENPAQSMKQRLKEAEALLKTSLKEKATLEQSQEVYQKAFHETPYMMHAVSEDGTIMMANKREHEILGYKDGELIGMSIYDLYAKNMHQQAKEGLRAVIEKGHHNMTYTTLLTKTNASVRCDISSSAIYDHNGKFLSTISVLRPIDADAMLRILNGIVDAKDGPLAKYLTKPEN